MSIFWPWKNDRWNSCFPRHPLKSRMSLQKIFPTFDNTRLAEVRNMITIEYDPQDPNYSDDEISEWFEDLPDTEPELDAHVSEFMNTVSADKIGDVMLILGELLMRERGIPRGEFAL